MSLTRNIAIGARAIILLVVIFVVNCLIFPGGVGAQASASPKQLKVNAIAALKEISTTDRRLKQTLDKVIRDIGRSLSYRGRALFIDNQRILPPPDGERVFHEERKAVERLLIAVKRRRTPDNIKPILQRVVGRLIEADRRITEHSIATAQRLVQVGEGSRRKVAKAQRELEKALRQTDPAKAIRGFEEAWKTSQKTVEGRELVIKSFDDSPDPLFVSVASNTLSATFQIYKKGRLSKEKHRGRQLNRSDEDDDRGKKHRSRYKDSDEKEEDHLFFEFVEVIQNSSGTIVRTLTTEYPIPPPSRDRKDRFVELKVSSVWGARDEEGRIVPAGTYSYVAFGQIVEVRSDRKKHGYRSERRRHRYRQSRYGGGTHKSEIEARSFPVAGTISVVQLGVEITSPLPGSVVNSSTVLVEGFIDALPGTEVGVTVNGVVAEINNGAFAAFVGLGPGNNVIAAKAVDPVGNNAMDSITVDVVDPQDVRLRLLVSPEMGLAPLTVELRPSSLLDRPIVLFGYDFEGDGIVDVSSATPDAVSHTYNQERLFFPTLTVTDDQGNQISTTTIVNVFPLPNLVAKWNAVKDALRIGDIIGALSFIAEESRGRYQEIFTVISPDLSQIDAFLTNINLLTVEGNQAEFEMLRMSEGVQLSFYVLFVRDNDGIWRLRTF